jgi:hypothetical protein
MQVSFKYSQEDLVDATVRFAGRSKTLRTIRRQQLIWGPILMASVAILILRFSILGAMAAAITALVCVMINPYFYDRRYRKNLRRFYKEKFW